MSYVYILDNSIIVKPEDPYIETGLLKHQKLRPQCHQLLVLLLECKQVDTIATYEMIGNVLWKEDGGWGLDKKQSLKDCVREINKIFKCITNIRGKGYILSVKAIKVPVLPLHSRIKVATRGWTQYAVENLELKENEIRKQLEYITILTAELFKESSAYEQLLIGMEKGAERRIIRDQLFIIRHTAEELKRLIPSKNIYLKDLSEERKAIVVEYHKTKNRSDRDFDKRLSQAKREFESLLSWCWDVKLDLERNRMALSDYEKLKEEIFE